MAYSYEIEPRPSDLGGGCKLRLIEDGIEVGGGVFLPDEDLIEEDPELAEQTAYDDALAEASAWLASR
jgi:hypothetical protein